MAKTAGVKFRWPRHERPLTNLGAFGYGCAFFDADGDGLLDILLVGEPVCGFFRNVGGGRFVDATHASGLDTLRAVWKGCAVGDYDGDGRPDLFLTGYHRNVLLRNTTLPNGGTRFGDVTAAAKLQWRGWGSSAGFMDLDNDGDLDLVLGSYVVSGPHTKKYCDLAPGVTGGCRPQEYDPEFAQLFRHNRDGTFTNVSRSAGFGTTNGAALAVAFGDYDNDGLIDVYIANDGTPGDLMHNLGGMRFKNVGLQAGVALSASGLTQAGMCADWGDYNGDGLCDLIVSAFADESYSLYRQATRGIFRHASEETGIALPTFKPLGFGGKFVDVDNDGWLDIVFVNGHVYDNIEVIDPSSTFRQAMMLFHNEDGKRFTDIAPRIGGLSRPVVGRGLAVGDYDNDGRMDLLVVDAEGEPLLLHNISQAANHYLTVQVAGSDKNRAGYGARVAARAGKRLWVGTVAPASSYLSSSDPRVHFGLGGVARLDDLTVRWLDGHHLTLHNVGVNRILRVTAPTSAQPRARPAAG